MHRRGSTLPARTRELSAALVPGRGHRQQREAQHVAHGTRASSVGDTRSTHEPQHSVTRFGVYSTGKTVSALQPKRNPKRNRAT